MPSIANLPTELIFFVASNLDKLRDLSSLACTNRKFYETVNPILYQSAVSHDDTWPLKWASHCGVAGTLRHALAAGADPNRRFNEPLALRKWKKSVAAARNAVADGREYTTWKSCGSSTPSSRWSPVTDSSNSATAVQSDSSTSDYDAWDDSMSDDTDGLSDSDSLSGMSDVDFYDAPSDDSGSVSPSVQGFVPDGWRKDNLVFRSFTPLHLAVRGGHNEAVEVLLDYGASVDSLANNLCDCKRASGLLNALEDPRLDSDALPPMWTPLHISICHARQETAKLLLSRGASCIMEHGLGPLSPEEEDPGCSTALHHAAGMGLVGLVQYLLDEGYQSQVDARDERSLTPFYYAYANERWDSTVPLLLSKGADINLDIDFFQPYCTITPLGESCRLGRYDVAERLIELGANPSSGFFSTGSGHRKGLSPLHLCCMPSARPSLEKATEALSLDDEDKATQRMRIMETLIDKGISIHDRDCYGDTPLITAAQNGVLPAVRALIKAGADVHVRNAVGRTAAMMALLGPPKLMPNSLRPGYSATLAQIVNVLFSSGAQIDDVDPHGNTVLHLIFTADRAKEFYFQTQALRLLLNQPSAGQLVLAKNNDGQTPFYLAFDTLNIRACEILVRQGCIHGMLQRDDLLGMFKRALQAPVDAAFEALDFVLDLDVNRELISDPSLFQELGKDAWRAAGLMASRGLPPSLAGKLSSEFLRPFIDRKQWDTVYYLLEAGVDVNGTSALGHSALSYLIYEYGSSIADDPELRQFVRVLLDRGANIHLTHASPFHERPLAKAIRTGSPKLVSLLLERQPMHNDPRAAGGRYLHYALLYCPDTPPFATERMLDTLLASGASTTELDDNGDAPLALLLYGALRKSGFSSQWPRFIKALSGPGVDINRKNKSDLSIADILEEALCGAEKAKSLAKMVQLVDGACGCRRLKFLPQPPKKVKPSDIL